MSRAAYGGLAERVKMKLIPLTQAKFAMVDDDMFDYLNQWKWYAVKNKYTYYAERHIWRNGKIIKIKMHRLILGAKKGEKVDHHNRNGLDCQLNNLRNCNNQQNSQNRRPQKNKTSKYKGVSFFNLNPKKPWKAQIVISGKHHHIGYFKTQKLAALAYDKKANELFGEFAYLNFPALLES